MKITVEGVTYEFQKDTADNVELMAIERVTGLTTGEWADALSRGSITCVTALIWILRRREEPNLKFDDVRFHPGSLGMEEDEDEEPGKAEGA